SPSMAEAKAMRVETPATGFNEGRASPFTKERATRSPVKEPGPTVTAKASILFKGTFASRQIFWTWVGSSAEWLAFASQEAWAKTFSPSSKAADPGGPEVSRLRRSIPLKPIGDLIEKLVNAPDRIDVVQGHQDHEGEENGHAHLLGDQALPDGK